MARGQCQDDQRYELVWPRRGVIATLAIAFIIHVYDSRELAARKAKAAQESTVRIAKEEAARISAMTPEQRVEEQKQHEEKLRQLEKVRKRNLGIIWQYTVEEDKMGRGRINHADVLSLNQVNFKPPYDGNQRMTLWLRSHPEYGKNILIYIQKGQFICDYDDCHVKVRFGTGKAVKFRVKEPSDGSSTALFISDYQKFVANLKKVDTIDIQTRFYQEGDKVFSFDVSGLVWKP